MALCTLLWCSVFGVFTAPGLRAAELPARFYETTVISGLEGPTSVVFASDGRVFVTEKSGIIKVFPSVDVPVPSVFADLRTNVHNYWDRGLTSLALHPDFPNTPYVYVLYTLDAEPGGVPPRWGIADVTGDNCPDPPGATTNGCVVSGRLSRLRAIGNAGVEETPILEGWCQQFPSHSVDDIAFGADGALYVSGGDGGSFINFDYGQYGSPLNPCGDPPVAVGELQVPPLAAGGSLRAQSPRRSSGQPAVFNGAVLRIDPTTGAALADNPLAESSQPNAGRIIAYGFRNPFRLAIRPGTNELWVADVGPARYEEIDRIADVQDATVENFGWPCYEGPERYSFADAADVALCESLYAASSTTPPTFSYRHDTPVVAGENSASSVGGAISALAFYDAQSFPAEYRGALFFGDLLRRIIWVVPTDVNHAIDFAARSVFASDIAAPVDVVVGPDGDLYYVDFYGNSVRRIRYYPGNQPPTAKITADPISGPAPLTVQLDGSVSSDPDFPNETLRYAWDLDNDGAYDDAATPTLSFTLQTPGSRTIGLRVTDSGGLTSTAEVVLSASNTPPVAQIVTPSNTTTWRVGQSIAFSGSGSDAQDGILAASRMNWTITLYHCPSDCHAHPLTSFSAVNSGSFAAPDHDYPSYLEITLQVTDADGLSHSSSVTLLPEIVAIQVESSPSGLFVGLADVTAIAPVQRTVIVGSRIAIAAPAPQGVGATQYDFAAWSDGGTRVHDINAPAQDTIYTATLQPSDVCTVEAPQCAAGGRAAGQITYFDSGVPVAGAVVTLRSDHTWFAQSAAQGQYMSPDIACDPCELTAGAGAVSQSDAITAIDASHLLRSLVGLNVLSDDGRLACDVSGDGRLTAIDASYILRWRVGLIDALPLQERCGSDWLFVPVTAADGATVTLPHIDATHCDAGKVTLPVNGITPGIDFHAVKIGDCNGSWQP